MVTRGAARIWWAIGVGLLLEGAATARGTVQGAARLGCVGFAAVGPGPLAPAGRP